MNHDDARNTKKRKGREAKNARTLAHAKKNLDVAAPLWVPRPILIVEKKVFGLGLEARGATTPRDNTGV